MLQSYIARPDQWSAHYNIGNYYMDLGRPEPALTAYSISLRLEPRAVLSLVNSALAYHQLGENEKAESNLEAALKIEPDNAPAHFNLGLLKADLKQPAQAEKHLRLALKHDPNMSQAAYNLGLLNYESSPHEGLELCRQAFKMNPSPKYACAIAQLLNLEKDHSGAEKTLDMIIKRWPDYSLAYLMLAEMYSRRGLNDQAQSVLKKGMGMQGISVRDKLRLAGELEVLREPKKQERSTGYE